jgi:hypothetical protein
MHEPPWQIACDENEIDATRIWILVAKWSDDTAGKAGRDRAGESHQKKLNVYVRKSR